jgi:hypothetical protein
MLVYIYVTYCANACSHLCETRLSIIVPMSVANIYENSCANIGDKPLTIFELL